MSYSFLRESKLYIVHGGNKYRIYTTSAITFNQTFAEDSYSVKTLHDQSKMFEGSSVTTANPANFSFEVPLTVEKDESIVMDLLNDVVETTVAGIKTQQLKTFNIYIQTGSSTFKLDTCAITAGNFNFSPREQASLEIEGEAAKLSRVGDESYNLGTIQSESSTRTPLLVYPVASIDSLSLNSLLSATVQVQNTIEWNPYKNVHSSLAVTSSSNAMFPSAYTLGNRIVSGAIEQYQTDSNITQFDDFSTSSNITVKAVKVGNASNHAGFWKININPAMYTARMEVQDLYKTSYDFRSTDNTTTDANRITQY